MACLQRLMMASPGALPLAGRFDEMHSGRRSLQLSAVAGEAMDKVTKAAAASRISLSLLNMFRSPQTDID
jgi:hypothetical protein